MIGASTLLILLHVLIFFVSIVVVVFVFPIRRWSLIKWLITLLSSFCLISFFCLSIFAQHDLELKILFSRLRFIGLAVLAPSWLLFLSSNFQVWKWLRRREIVIALYAPSVVTAVCSVWPPFQDLILQNFAPIQALGLSVVRYQAGGWYPVHYLWSVLLLVASFVLEFQVTVHGTQTQRKQVAFLFVGSLISLITDVYCVVTDSPYRWAMLPAGSYLFTALAVAYGVFRQRLFASMLIDVEKVYLQLPDPVIILNQEGKIIGFNNASQSAFFLTDTMMDSAVNEALPGLPSLDGDFHHKSASGAERFFELTHKDFGHPQETTGRVLFFREVTYHKAAEKKLLDDAQFRGLLMKLIAHDMFGHIQTQTRLIEVLKNDVGTNSKDMAQVLATSSVASRDLIQSLLIWAKTQDGEFKPQRHPFELGVFLEDVIEELAGPFQEKDVRVAFKAPEKASIVDGDSQMLGAVLRNLLTNALRASSPGQTVTVQAFTKDHAYGFIVEDLGVGMSEEEVSTLLDPNRKNVFKGVGSAGFGIGFKLVNYFVALHRGNIQIQSHPAKGTVVKLSFPL